MPEFSPQDLAKWTGGKWTVTPALPLTSVSHDTRLLKPGALYVALPGKRIDGHELIGKAREAGANAVLGLKGKGPPSFPILEVADVGKGLQDMAKGYRKTLSPKHLIGVTGSAGKTTVKDFVSAMLSQAGPTCSTQGNWNNFIGLPLSMLAMESTDAFGVFEMGMNHAGEIKSLGEILQPEMGLITSIGEAHLEQLGSLEAIAEEKTSLLANLPSDGFAVLDQDSPWFAYVKSRCACPFVTVSLNEKADLQGELRGDKLFINDQKRQQQFSVPLPLPGQHMVMNVLQSVALVLECGLSPDQISTGLERYKVAPMRWQKIEVAGRSIINDAYNANPLSMRKSIQTFADLDHPDGKWLVLGGMSELGVETKSFHLELGKEIEALGFDGVLLVGEQAACIGSGIQTTKIVEVVDALAAAHYLNSSVHPQSLLLLKGSRSERMELVLIELQKIEKGIL